VVIVSGLGSRGNLLVVVTREMAAATVDVTAVHHTAVTADRILQWVALALCGAGAACMLAALAVDLDSTAAKALMASAAICFVPGAFLLLAWVRLRMGPPQ
jgi:hypothetical protein